MTSLVVMQAISDSQIAAVRELFLEYAGSLDFSLCFQGFDKELAELPGEYAPPEGRLLLAEWAGEAAGCVAMHKSGDGTCELKRLYLRPNFRGRGIGGALVNAMIAEARSLGYRRMRLDTVKPIMENAVALYRRLGFEEIAAYRPNPIAGALYMELNL